MERIREWFSGAGLDFDVISRAVVNVAIVLLVLTVLLWINKKVFRIVAKRLEKHGKAEYAGYIRGVSKIIKGLLVFVCIVACLYQIPGLEQLMTSLLASSGILALVVGVASKDAAANLVSGLLISIFKPFAKGDTIKMMSTGIIGTVEEISLRHTILRTVENKRVIVPNSTMNSEAIENAHFGDTSICNYVEVGFTYESDLAKAKKICIEVAEKNSRLLDKRTKEAMENGESIASVGVLRLDDSAVVLRIAMWTVDTANGFSAKCEVLEQLKERVDGESGIEFAYPHLEIVGRA